MDKLPDLTLVDPNGAPVRLAALPRPLVVYFYPKDDTSGCTREAQDFSALADDFAAAGVALLGISKDSPKRHSNFIAKYDLKVPLASDEDGAACEAFGVWVERSMYGKKYFGTERSTFVINPEGRIKSIYRKVKPEEHTVTVIEDLRHFEP